MRHRVITMCINCNLLCPLHDEVADMLFVPRRMYLARSCELSDYLDFKSGFDMSEDTRHVSYKLHNFETCNSITPKDVKQVTVTPLVGVKLYTGKLVSSVKLPEYDSELYLELFEEAPSA